MSLVAILLLLFVIGLGLIAFGTRGDVVKAGQITCFVSALIYLVTLLI